MPKREHLIDRLTERITTDVERTTDAMADKVNAELLDDNREMSAADYRAYWQQHWPDPTWRAQQLERMGPTAFYDAAMEHFDAPKPEPLSRLAREGMARGAVNRTQAVAPTPAPAPAGPGY